ncbi:hypothetical protein N7519_004945 [Penicillium mononematosum]|uniref:uncharacterized protein n=1 Tax=Penicillium mononematosum TaxID=268346 RepID=UPI002546F8F9|nr:uncharacterized protein N7519_004945 [Penicillium mononematosum]KAJ6183644.1 hypothetical protein N7519_004945 [Penicillium mononematosum]
MSDKKETPPTNQPPAAPTTSNKVGKRKRQRPRPPPPRKELEKVLASGADAASGAAPASSTGPAESSTPPAASTTAASTSAPNVGNTGVAVPAVGLAHHTTIASLVPELQLMDDETTALARYLPDLITAFVHGRRITLKVP